MSFESDDHSVIMNMVAGHGPYQVIDAIANELEYEVANASNWDRGEWESEYAELAIRLRAILAEIKYIGTI